MPLEQLLEIINVKNLNTSELVKKSDNPLAHVADRFPEHVWQRIFRDYGRTFTGEAGEYESIKSDLLEDMFYLKIISPFHFNSFMTIYQNAIWDSMSGYKEENPDDPTDLHLAKQLSPSRAILTTDDYDYYRISAETAIQRLNVRKSIINGNGDSFYLGVVDLLRYKILYPQEFKSLTLPSESLIEKYIKKFRKRYSIPFEVLPYARLVFPELSKEIFLEDEGMKEANRQIKTSIAPHLRTNYPLRLAGQLRLIYANYAYIDDDGMIIVEDAKKSPEIPPMPVVKR